MTRQKSKYTLERLRDYLRGGTLKAGDRLPGERELAETLDGASDRAQRIFDACATRNLHLALVQLPQRWFRPEGVPFPVGVKVTCLRSVLMKPEHEAWLDRIWDVYSAACSDVLN